YGHLTFLDGVKERLHLFKSNLLEEGAFDVVVNGYGSVFHIVSPFYHGIKDPQIEMIDPTLKGTLNILGSVAKHHRVVLTSFVVAVAFNGKPRTPKVVVDETWWSNLDFCRESHLWYVLSKILAIAWMFVKDKTFNMVIINPTMVIGILLRPILNASCAFLLQFLNSVLYFKATDVSLVTISKDYTVILDGVDGTKKSIEERCEQIKSAIELSTSDYDKEKLQGLAKISGGVANMHV
ncbi:phenylacetaldehyde reductase-like, partial [Capsicum annuum]|uniref:phenylacetaldehyde reductase-like n=1 Tax=Capsicum annuum TaxID=4072 RepID=UPI001FB0EF76